MSSSSDPPEAIPIMVGWLRHLDERVPADQRRAWRVSLLRNLISKHTRGNRDVVDTVLNQFDIDPPISNEEREAAGLALEKAADPTDFPRVAEIIRRSDPASAGMASLVRWLGRIKTDEAKQLAVDMLANPRTRADAMRALVQQRATGVRDAVAAYLDDEHEVWRKHARKTLDKLPPG